MIGPYEFLMLSLQTGWKVLKIIVLRAQMVSEKVLQHQVDQEFDVLSIGDSFRVIREVLNAPEQIYFILPLVGIQLGILISPNEIV